MDGGLGKKCSSEHFLCLVFPKAEMASQAKGLLSEECRDESRAGPYPLKKKKSVVPWDNYIVPLARFLFQSKLLFVLNVLMSSRK